MVFETTTGERIGLLPGTGYDLGSWSLRYPREQRTMLRVLADQAKDRPDKTWVVFDSRDSLTYTEAYLLSNRVGDAVRQTVGDGAHVGLFLRNQIEFLPTFYGAMSAGGVAVPLSADARGPLLQYVIEHSDIKLIVARADLLDRLQDLEALGELRLVVVVGDGERPDAIGDVPLMGWDEWVADRSAAPPAALPAYHQMAVMQFTSGTTGRPKGAIYSHQFLYLYASLLCDSLEHTEDDVLSTPLPLFHVAAVHIIANSALHVGATAHLKSRFSASRYWDDIAADGATFSIIMGPMAGIVLKVVDAAPPHRCAKSFVVPPVQREEFQRRYGTTVHFQGFGMTEIMPMPSRADLISDVPEDFIGYPATWMEYGVVDEHDYLLGPGEVGELVFRSLLPHAMADGYYRNGEATAQAFRNFMFHTGDLARYDETGALYYMGRRQERIRHRGENVSALALEFVALSHPSVVEAAAYGVPAEFGEEDVKLDVLLKDDLSVEQLHAWLQRNLPRFMVPRYIERRESFPKTPSERIEKYRLAQQPLGRPEVFDAGERKSPQAAQ